MTVVYMLDTNIVSDLVRRPHGPVAQKIKLIGEQAVATSIIVAAELRYGAARRRSRSLTEQLEAILGSLTVLPLETPADRTYGDLRASLEAQGKPIGANDFLIASHALALGAILVTNDENEFERVDGLKIENWIE